MPNLKRTQIYFPERVIDSLKHKAKRENKSMAEIIRVAVKKYLTGEETVDWDNDSVWRVKTGKSKRGDLSLKHDKYLYER